MRAARWLALFAAMLLFTAEAAAEETVELDLEEALRLAGEHAPKLRETRAEIAVARAGVESAEIWRNNPSLSLTSGPRFGPDDTSVDFMVGVKQSLTLGGRPDARARVAEARQRVAELEVRDAERVVVAEAARAFANLLYWQRRADLIARNLQLVEELSSVAERRKEVGDVGALDPSLARLTRSRLIADSAQVEAARLEAESELRWLLGLDGVDLALKGDLRVLARTDLRPDSDKRSDVALAEALVDVARARYELADLDSYPVVTIGAAGGREESATVFKGVLEFTLPFIWYGQDELYTSQALEQARREGAEIVASWAAHETQLARQRVTLLEEAVEQFAEEGLSNVARTAEIAVASYRAGAIPLPDLLVVRRELVAAELEFSQLLLLTALARIELLESSGAIDSLTPKNP